MGENYVCQENNTSTSQAILSFWLCHLDVLNAKSCFLYLKKKKTKKVFCWTFSSVCFLPFGWKMKIRQLMISIFNAMTSFSYIKCT